MSQDLQNESQRDSSSRMYDTRAKSYDDSHHPSFAQKFLSFANLAPGNRVLDLACGTGLVTIAAAEAVGPGGNVVGVDVSSGMLNEARRKLDEQRSEIRDVVTLAEHSISELDSLDCLRGRADTFDLVTCCSALVLLDDPEAAVGKSMELLKPIGGTLVVDVPHPKNQRVAGIMERVCRRLDVKPPFNRSWVTSDKSLPELIVRASGGALEVQDVVLVEPIAGFGTRYFDATEQEASERFEESLHTEAWRNLREGDEEIRQKVGTEFIEDWKQAVEEDGKVVDIDGVYVAIAKRR